jgi:hypothetical protein
LPVENDLKKKGNFLLKVRYRKAAMVKNCIIYEYEKTVGTVLTFQKGDRYYRVKYQVGTSAGTSAFSSSPPV